MARIPTRLGSVLLLTLAVGTVSAHEGHETHTPAGSGAASTDPLTLALFASGLLVLGAGVYLTRREDVDTTYALTGVGLGVAGLLGGALTYLL